ncbi:MAG: hypothetical protein U5L00_02030 [Desulfovermiculus sp.]|nr:hypothetical protein [Desulfovermiculus sp.]
MRFEPGLKGTSLIPFPGWPIPIIPCLDILFFSLVETVHRLQ